MQHMPILLYRVPGATATDATRGAAAGRLIVQDCHSSLLMRTSSDRLLLSQFRALSVQAMVTNLNALCVRPGLAARAR